MKKAATLASGGPSLSGGDGPSASQIVDHTSGDSADVDKTISGARSSPCAYSGPGAIGLPPGPFPHLDHVAHSLGSFIAAGTTSGEAIHGAGKIFHPYVKSDGDARDRAG